MEKRFCWCSMLLALILASGSLSGTVFAAQNAQQMNTKTEDTAVRIESADANQDAAAVRIDPETVFEKKVEELEKEYGVLKAGPQPCKVDAKEFLPVWRLLLMRRPMGEFCLQIFVITIWMVYLSF